VTPGDRSRPTAPSWNGHAASVTPSSNGRPTACYRLDQVDEGWIDVLPHLNAGDSYGAKHELSHVQSPPELEPALIENGRFRPALARRFRPVRRSSRSRLTQASDAYYAASRCGRRAPSPEVAVAHPSPLSDNTLSSSAHLIERAGDAFGIRAILPGPEGRGLPRVLGQCASVRTRIGGKRTIQPAKMI
jgi:hypothetical protein